IELWGARVLVRDLDSTNGTFVNGTRVTSAEIRPGTLLGMGSARLHVFEEGADAEDAILGESEAIERLKREIAKLAAARLPVLIHGETGTGKELVALALHRLSGRRGGFVPLNCGSIARELVESELFGHERGAFTGAVAQKPGRLEVADGGTVFLDEIGEMTPALQAKLLRVLQEQEFERVGGTRPIKVDVRVVAATNRDLKEMTRAGTFREDLFYRINVAALEMPSLAARRDDIPLLARYFASKYAARCNRHVVGFTQEAIDALMACAWPGNVRELENAIERAVVLGSSEVLRPEDLPESVLEAAPAAGPAASRYHEAILEAKKDIILKAFKEAGGNYVETARLLDVHPNYLHRLVRNMNLKGLLRK
ncbi:MAG TPA: sigma 54-interacting transcriptional regulator, partial [Candidatus Binatia bacterium]|nr:sigma 54-interacting transcriptional regulator [Candidatus Binatia bacterium]